MTEHEASAGGHSQIRWEHWLNRGLIYLGVAIFLFVVLLPFYWIFLSSVTPKFLMFSIPPRYLPQEITFENYINMTKNIPFYRYLGNSLIFAIGSSVISVACVSASYALARIRFPGSNIIFMLFIVSIAVPQIGTIVPLFEMYKQFGLINSHFGIILLMGSLIIPFTVWIMVPFVQQIPAEIEEAASMDGARLWQVLWFVVVPVMKPALATMFIINFIISWNELLYPLVLPPCRHEPSASGCVGGRGPVDGAGRPWDMIGALSVTMMIPVLLLVLLFNG
jgi:ABC-type glycerol-3-phosphate transport system permease component